MNSRIQLKSPELYNVWKGQIFIQEQLVCDIALQSLNYCSIPAQLPDKLEIKEVIQLSELRKKLPENIFQKADFTGQEVCFENVYYTFYPTITSNVIRLELDKLLKWLKEKDLAIIQVLNDQGFFMLMTSPLLPSNKGPNESVSSCLTALFLFPHSKFLSKREKEEFTRDDISLKISTLLPGLQYAIMETSQMRKNKNICPDALVERFFRKYAILQRNNERSSEIKAEQSDIPCLINNGGHDVPKKCDQLALSRLQFYFSSPVNFTVPLMKMSSLLTETTISNDNDKSTKNGGSLVVHDSVALESKLSWALEAKVGRESPHGNSALHGRLENRSSKSTVKKGGTKRRKKSKQKPAQRTVSSSENQTSSKKPRLLSDNQKQVGSSSNTTLILACDPFPQRKKRGAEVLTAEFVKSEKGNMSEKTIVSKRKEELSSTPLENAAVAKRVRKKLTSEDPFRVPDRPPKRKASEPGNKKQSPEIKNRLESLKRPLERHREKTERQSKKLEKIKNVAIEQTNSVSKANENVGLDASKCLFTQIPENSILEKRIGLYESHALNLLADLALNSFCSSSSPYIQSEYVAHSNEPLVKEKASTGESESTLPHPQKDSSLSELSTAACKEPEQNLEDKIEKTKDGSDASHGNTTSQQRVENSEKPITHKAHVAAAKAKARNNATSKISLEHSYSQLPLDDIPNSTSKEATEQHAASVADATVSSSTPDMVVEKSSNVFLPRQILLLTSDKLPLAVAKQPRTVSKVEDKFVITFCWEAKYDFDLDSKFTSDPLEKTVNRALHGPWNHHLKEKVEDVKIILHMWLALFYSKPNKQQNYSSRKVVEHSNPAKYVSINTVLDPFEFYEIVESDAIQLCTADSNNANAVSPVARKSGTTSQGKLHKLAENQNENHPEDLGLPTKDYNVELSSETFQTCKSSERTFYSNSILTTMKCQMAEMSQSAPQPTNYMRKIFDAKVPAACYISDTKQLNSDLNDKSENCVDIVGGSSGKVNYRGNEHQYYKAFSNKTQLSPEQDYKKLNKDADENKENAKIYETANSSGSASLTQGESSTSHKVKVSPVADEEQEATEKTKLWITQDYYCAETKNVQVAEVTPSSAFNVDIPKENTSMASPSTQNHGHPKYLEKAYADESSLHARKQLVSNLHTIADLHKTTLPIAENKDLPDDSIIPTDDAAKDLIVEKNLPVQSVHTFQNDDSTKDLIVKTKEPVQSAHTLQEDDDASKDLIVEKNEPVQSAHTLHNDDDDATKDFIVTNNEPVQSTHTLHNERVKDLGIRDQITIQNLSTCDLSESSSHLGKDIKTACIDNAKVTASENGKVLDSNRGLVKMDYISALLSVKSPSTIHSLTKKSGKPRKLDEAEHQTPGIMASLSTVKKSALELSESTESCTEMDLDCPESTESRTAINLDFHESTASSTLDMDYPSRSKEERKTDSAPNTTPEDVLEKMSETLSEKTNDCVIMKEHSKLVKNGTPEVIDVLTSCSVYSQAKEHSYVSKMTAERRKQLELSILAARASYVKSTSTTPENSDVKSTNASIFSERMCVKEADKGLSQSTEPEEAYMSEELESAEEHVPVLHKESSSIPEKGPVCEMQKGKIDVLEKDVSHTSGVDRAVREKQELPLHTQCNISSAVLCDENELSVTPADPGSKESEAVTSAVNVISHHNSDNMEEIAERLPEGNTSTGTDSCKVDDFENISVFENLNSEGNSDTGAIAVSTVVEKPKANFDIHSKELSENTNTENIYLPETLNEKTNLTGSVLVEKEMNALSSNTRQTNAEIETSFGESTLKTESTLPVSKFSDENVEQLPAESASRVERNRRNSSSNKKEIFSKLKLICLGSSSGQQAVSVSEHVLLENEKLGTSGSEGNNGQMDPKTRAESVRIHDVNESTPDSTNVVVEDTSPGREVIVENNLLPEISPPDIFVATPEPSEKLTQMPSQNSCLTTCNDFTGNMEKDLVQEQSDICFIVNSGTITKEQYDRWSETSDEDIEFIQAYEGPLSPQENKAFQKEKHELLSSSLEKLSIYNEPTPLQKPKYFKGLSSSSTLLCQAGDYSSKYYQDIDDVNSRSNRNVIVTKTVRDPCRTMLTVHGESPYTGMSDLDNLFSNRRIMSDNPTQNTLDLEHLRFICNLKDVLRKSSTDKHVCEPPFQTMFESNRIPSCSSSIAKSRCPLLITVHCPNRRRDIKGRDSCYPSSYYSQAYNEDEVRDRPVYYSRTPKRVRTNRYSPFHFNRLRYENTQDKSHSDISVILRECVQSNHLKLSSVGLGNSTVDRNSDSRLTEQDVWQTRRTIASHASKFQPVKNIISELCTSLHSRLHSVAIECAQKNIYFFINETSDDAFYCSTKSLLINDGCHIPTDPQDFCHSQNTESNKLLVIIKNEDISSKINKIPCLLQLKLLPNVTFAGVDVPEDLTEFTYQELFQTGGFLVSDKTVLENITLGKLKEVLAVIEKMNKTSAWKWLIHFRENRRLKEDKRTESLSHIKISLLKTYQQSNIIEILPYHQCDSRDKELSNDLACLLSAQRQHIHSRLAVYLTGTPGTVAEEFEQNGILVYDVDTFIRKIQKVDAQLQDSSWS